MNAIRSRAVLAVLLLAAAACDDPVQAPLPAEVRIVTVHGVPEVFLPGDTAVLEAVPRLENGSPLPKRPVSWSSVDTTVASVSPTGVLIARAPGVARIRAVIEGKLGTEDVVVGRPWVTAVVLAPGTLALGEGDAAQLYVEVRGPAGRVLDDRPVTFESLDPDIVQVTAGGVVLGVRPGSARVRATVEGVVGEALVSVAPRSPTDTVRIVVVTPNPVTMKVGDGVLFYADVRTTSGAQMPGARIDGWKSQDTTIATVSSTGVVRALRPGKTRIMAKSGSAVGYSDLTVVSPAPIHAYRLTWRDGEVSQAIDTVDVVGTDGTVARAHLYLKSATLTLDTERHTFDQVFVADVVAAVGGAPLGIRFWSVSGQITYNWLDGTMLLHPTGAVSPSFRAAATHGGGLLVRQSVLGGAEFVYLYLPNQP